ncbi:MAG: SDR family NAD(P)-dependent oxidoreductase [Pseudomonadales bacterium]|nr:SDR family NAD(P)-dependent oxidoreductase [Pseudomonadales bacterium]
MVRADTNLPSPDLANKVYVVTGANSGIGYAAAENFAGRGAALALVCRSAEKGTEALSRIRGKTNNMNINLFIADFTSLSSVARVAKEINHTYDKVHVLCNNAGGANSSRTLTKDGFETTFQANHLAGFLLTKLLLPALLNAAEDGSARVVFTSSLGHKNSPLEFDDLNLEKNFSTLRAYGRSKLMNLLTARAIHKRYGDKNVIASSFHPGAVRTPIWRKGGILATVLGILMWPFMWSIKKGSDTFIWLASSNDEDVLSANGNYFFNRKQVSISAFATDEAAEQLWRASEELVQPFLPTE